MLRFLTGINWLAVGAVVGALLAFYYFFLGNWLNDMLDSFDLLDKIPFLGGKGKTNGGKDGTNGGKVVCAGDCPNGAPKVEWTSTPHPSGQYGDSNPAERLPEVIAEFGSPDLIDPSKGGMAIWKRSTLNKRGKCWERIEIVDEQIPHDVPAPHTDFLYGEYKLAIPDHLVDEVLDLSESVSYDPLKKTITARCHIMGPVKATALLAMYIATGRMSGRGAKSQYGDYVLATIPGSDNYDPNAELRYERELCEYYHTTRAAKFQETAQKVKEETKQAVKEKVEAARAQGEGEPTVVVKKQVTVQGPGGEAEAIAVAQGKKIEGFCSAYGVPYANF